MNSATKARPARSRQRPGLTPPHVSLAVLRHVTGRTLDDLIDAIEEVTGRRYTRGTLSALERGLRGASPDLLGALEQVYGIPAGSITTAYKAHAPRGRAA